MEKVVGVKLKNFNDLVRLAASSIAMGQPTFILRFRKSNQCIYGVLAVFRDFYKLYGVPILYFYSDISGELPEDRNYVLLRSDEAGEHVEFSKGSKTGYVTIPIINLETAPEFMSVQ